VKRIPAQFVKPFRKWSCFGLDTAGEFIMLGREPS
jgi:hypothetical protein